MIPVHAMCHWIRMKARIKLDDLVQAAEWVTAGKHEAVDCEAYVDRASGVVIWAGEGIDEELPEDIDDESKYAAVPDKDEFALGRALALSFAKTHAPSSYERIEQYFRKAGAYGRFKSELDRLDRLEEWHAYEQRAIEDALRGWAEDNGLEVVA
jgi:hypothetical protein